MSLSGVDLPVPPQHCAEQQILCFEIFARLSVLPFSSEQLDRFVIGDMYFPLMVLELPFACRLLTIVTEWSTSSIHAGAEAAGTK